MVANFVQLIKELCMESNKPVEKQKNHSSILDKSLLQVKIRNQINQSDYAMTMREERKHIFKPITTI